MKDDDVYKLADSVDSIENGNTIAVYIKWHVDPIQAKRVLHSFCKNELGFDDDEIENLREPKHERWRKVPSQDEWGSHMMRFIKGSGPGSFPVTVIDFEDWSRE